MNPMTVNGIDFPRELQERDVINFGQCGVLRGLMNQVRNDMKPSCPTFHFGSLNSSYHTTWEDQRALVSRMIKDLDESEPYGSLEEKLVNWNKTCAAYTGGNGRNRSVEARGPGGASSSSYEDSLEICSAWSSLEIESEEETESEKVAADVRVKIRIAMASVGIISGSSFESTGYI